MYKKLLLLLLWPFGAAGQNSIALPDIINYTKASYNAGLQTWDIAQDSAGLIYFANNEGLLSFDGRYWKSYPLPNKTIVRSVAIGSAGRIYVGGQDEIGYFSPDKAGRLVFTSLRLSLPENERDLDDVWDIVVWQTSVFFRTPSKIVWVNGREVKVYHSPSEWAYLGVCQGRLYAHDYQKGLLQFNNGNWVPAAPVNTLPKTDPVTAVLPANDSSLLVATLKNGFFTLGTNGLSKKAGPNLAAIAAERIYAATAISPSTIAVGTSTGGVSIVSEKGELVQRFSKAEGLQNNNVLCVFLDKEKNLWMGLDDGIDFVAYNSAIKRVVPTGQPSAGYTAALFQNQLYIGTSAGVFRAPLQNMPDLSYSKGMFTPVANTAGQAWNLSIVNGQLLLGHHDGAFALTEKGAFPIQTDGRGFWNFVPLADTGKAASLVAGTYKGLQFYTAIGDRFVPAGTVPKFIESSRFVVPDAAGNIWVSHPYHGVYKVAPDKKGGYVVKLYTSRNGLPSSLNNHVYKVRGEVVMATEQGIYQYNSVSDSFTPSPFYTSLLGRQSVRYLKEDADGNLWFVHEKSLGLVNTKAAKPATVYLPELSNKLLSGFENIYPVDRNNIFVGAEKGFFHINLQKYRATIPALGILIREVRITDKTDSILYGGYSFAAGKNLQPVINNRWKTIRFEFAAPLFSQLANIEYSYRLKGFSDAWSDWSKKTEKEYTNLTEGAYSFEVKARNNLGNESAPATYSFRILPPWYRTVIAYLVYLLLFCTAIYFLWRRQQKRFALQQARHEEEQKRQAYLHQLELDKAEKELIALRNEKLQAEVEFKNSELATTAMHLVQKGELLTKMKSELNQVLKSVDNENAGTELKKMVRLLNEGERTDQDWEQFIQHFDKVHSGFVARLKEKHPTITSNEIKLCTFLRLNLSTKEIAQLMSISVRGVEISRYRLRKKLSLTSEVSLFEYLMKVG